MLTWKQLPWHLMTVYTKALQQRVRQRREAAARLRWVLALDPKVPRSDDEETALTFYAASIGPLALTGPRRFGRRALIAWCARLEEALGPLAEGRPVRVALPTFRSVEARPASGSLGGIQVRPVADLADKLLLGVLEDLRLVGLEALIRCGYCGRLGLRLRQNTHPACSARCAQALRTRKFRQERREQFLASRRRSYQRTVAQKLGKPVEKVRIASRRRTRPAAPSPEVVSKLADEALARFRRAHGGRSPGDLAAEQQRARETHRRPRHH